MAVGSPDISTTGPLLLSTRPFSKSFFLIHFEEVPWGQPGPTS